MSKLFYLLCCCVLFAASEVSAWSSVGHMVVAQMAYNHLEPAVKARCDALIAVSLTNGSSMNNTFVTSACWADDYKTELGTGNWHYIDIPFSLDGTTTNGVVPDSFDVVRALRQCAATLQNTNAGATNLATSLRYLIHLMGDIHQPLHCSTAVSAAHKSGDAGGNSFPINGTWSNLHSLWDSAGGFLASSLTRPLTTSGQNSLNAKVAEIEAALPYTSNGNRFTDPMDLASEGKTLAQTVSYVGITTNTSPSTNYLAKAKMTGEERLAQGGHRLADLLNNIVASTPMRITSSAVSAHALTVSWPSTSGKIYRVQWKAELSDESWTTATNFTASATTSFFTETASHSRRFYRVVE